MAVRKARRECWEEFLNRADERVPGPSPDMQNSCGQWWYPPSLTGEQRQTDMRARPECSWTSPSPLSRHEGPPVPHIRSSMSS